MKLDKSLIEIIERLDSILSEEHPEFEQFRNTLENIDTTSTSVQIRMVQTDLNVLYEVIHYNDEVYLMDALTEEEVWDDRYLRTEKLNVINGVESKIKLDLKEYLTSKVNKLR